MDGAGSGLDGAGLELELESEGGVGSFVLVEVASGSWVLEVGEGGEVFFRFFEPGSFLRECVRPWSVRDLRREVRVERVVGRGERMGMVFVGVKGVEH